MLSAINSAASGLQAYSQKTEATANNIANMNTPGFKSDVVTFSSQVPQGVTTNVSKNESAGPLMAEQTSDGMEMVEQSNTDLTKEIPDLIMEKNGFSANLKTLQAADEMTKSLLDIKA